nr:hypothetical protein [Tanacetum cinerariifolium]
MPKAVPVSIREPKRIVNQSIAKLLRRTAASESTNQKPRHTTRKLYEHVMNTCNWWYPKFTPPGYKWKPKSQIGNVNPKVSMPLENVSRTANILKPMTPRNYTMSNTTLYSNSLAARRDYPIHHRLWALKAHDEKSIEKLKGKSMDTKFEKSSVIRQPNAFKSQRPSILRKPTIFSDSLERKDFSKSKSVIKNNVSINFSKPVTAQILPPNKKSILKNTNVLAQGMYKIHTKPTQTRTTQLPQDSRKTNKRMSFSTGVIPTTSVSIPQLKSNQMEDKFMLNNSQGKK